MGLEPDIEIEWVQAPQLELASTFVGRVMDFLTGSESGDYEFEDDSPWEDERVLYAYFDPETDEILYIGKAWGTTVINRFIAADKDKLWDRLSEDEDDPIHKDDLDVLIGTPSFSKRSRLTKETLAYLESLLIWKVRPFGNKQGIRSYKPRDGTVVKCTGAWPERHKTYVDEE